MTTLTPLERAKLLDLRTRIADGEYDSDRMPDTRLMRLCAFLCDHAGALILYSLLWGVGLAALLLEWLLLNG